MTAHRSTFTQGRDTRTVDPDPRILSASDFADLAAEQLAGRLVVAGARQYLVLPDGA